MVSFSQSLVCHAFHFKCVFKLFLGNCPRRITVRKRELVNALASHGRVERFRALPQFPVAYLFSKKYAALFRALTFPSPCWVIFFIVAAYASSFWCLDLGKSLNVRRLDLSWYVLVWLAVLFFINV